MAKHAKPVKRETTDLQMAEFVARMIVNLGTRAGKNPEALATMPGLQQLLRDEYRAAGRELYESGVSLPKLAEFMTAAGHKMSKQAAQQQFSAAGQTYVRKRGQATEIVRKAADVAHVASKSVWPERHLHAVPNNPKVA